ncbi:MAG: hypothetical protein FJY67_09400 [Calditrichaeota bacterium]|nr:hypothetical protein [Calditrichota bacterium]
MRLLRLQIVPLAALLAFSGCTFMTNEERLIRETVQQLLTAAQNNDEDAAHAILLDVNGFMTLNPDAGVRSDAAAFSDAVLSDLITNFRNMVKFIDGKEVKVKRFHLGSQWYQYKGFPAFKESQATISVEGESADFTIRGMVKINNQWRVVDLSDNGLF